MTSVAICKEVSMETLTPVVSILVTVRYIIYGVSQGLNQSMPKNNISLNDSTLLSHR